MLTDKQKKFLMDTLLMQVKKSGEFSTRLTALPFLSTGDLKDADLEILEAAFAEQRKEDSESSEETPAENEDLNLNLDITNE